MAKVTQGASKRGEAKAREISAVPNSPENLASIAKNANSDGQKYQYAVQLAKQDLGGDTSDDAEFRNLVDSYYEQMDPETSAEDMRGETMVTQAIRGVGEAYDQVNDTLGDGIDWLWDNTAGNVAGFFGGVADLFTGGQTDFGDEWRQGVSDWVSPETADAIASMGTGMLVSAIPGVGVPLSIGLTAAQNSDDLYEALSGRDGVSLEELDANQRLGRFGSAVLDTALAAAPAVGKLGRGAKGAKLAWAVDDADAAVRAAAGGKTIQQAAEKANALRQAAGDVARGEMSEASAKRIADLFGDAVVAKPQRTGFRGAIDRLSGSTLGEALKPTNQVRALTSSVAHPGFLARNAPNAAKIDSLRALASEAAPEAAKGAAKGAVKETAKGAAKEAAKGGLKEAAKGIGGRAAKGLGGAATSLMRNIGAGAGLNYLNYMGQTGDSNFVNWGGQVAQNPSNWMIALAPKVARAMPGSSKVFGRLGLTGPSGTGRATSVAQRGIGNNVQPAYDPGLSDEEIRRRILWSEGR